MIRAHERGYSLIIAVAIISLLTAMGAVVLQQAAVDVQLAGADRAAQNSLYVAEAGALWGQQELTDMLFPAGTAIADGARVSALSALPRLEQTDVLCPENNCKSPPCAQTIDCTRFFLLTPNWVTYGNGRYRAAATCEPSCSVAAPQAYIVRAIGQTNENAGRLLEVVVGP